LGDVKEGSESSEGEESLKHRAAELRSQLIKSIEKRFSGASPEERKAIHDRLWNMIQYAIGRHDYWEEYRTRYLTIATALVSVAAAAVAILVTAKVGLTAIGIYGSFIILGCTGGYMLRKFQKETSPDYPYRSVSKVTSWIYFYPLVRNEKLLRDSLPKTAAKELREQAAKDYLTGLEKFTKDWSSMNEWEHIQEDIEQVLILFTLQAYKRMLARQMAQIFETGIIVSAVLLVFGIILYSLWT
jgi:preprotein translocase subunit Sec61beta